MMRRDLSSHAARRPALRLRRKRFRGYDPERVDQFREQVAEELERLTRVNQELDAKAQGFHEQLRAFRERDKALNEALVSAQQLRAEIREQAEREAQLIIREARAEGERSSTSIAQRDPRSSRPTSSALERSRRAFLAQLRQIARAPARGDRGGGGASRGLPAPPVRRRRPATMPTRRTRAHDDARLAGVARQGMTPYRFDDPRPHVAVPPRRRAHARAGRRARGGGRARRASTASPTSRSSSARGSARSAREIDTRGVDRVRATSRAFRCRRSSRTPGGCSAARSAARPSSRCRGASIATRATRCSR